MEKATLTALKKIIVQLDGYSAKLKKTAAALNAAIEKEGKMPPKAKAKAPKKPVATVKKATKSTGKNAEVKIKGKPVQGKTQVAAPVKVAAPVAVKAQKAPKTKASAQKAAKKQKTESTPKTPAPKVEMTATVPVAPEAQPKAKRGRPRKNNPK